MRVLAVGSRALLVEVDSLGAVLALHAALLAARPAGVIDVVAAARTVLVSCTDADAAATARALVDTLDLSAAPQRDETLVEVRVLYDGADLEAVANLTGLSVEAVIAAHTGQTWTAAFGGFAPGFTYCVGEHHALDVPRRATPRTAVPAGAVGLAGEFSAVYPRATPGGWQLIGRSPEGMWDPTRDRPALVAPGNRVRYVAVREAIEARPAQSPRRTNPPAAPGGEGKEGVVKGGVEILATGPQSLLQDAGRPGYADLGVTASGAADRGSAAGANALVGNPPGATVVECLGGGLALTAHADHLVAVTGAAVPLTLSGPAGKAHPPTDTPLVVLAGHTLALGAPEAGLRAYLAVRGGFRADPVLGSASTDLLSGEGPAPLRAGDLLAVGTASDLVAVPLTHPREPLPAGHLDVRLRLGPRADWFTPDAVASFFGQHWRVTPDANRIGIRLAGQPLTRAIAEELASEGTVAGAVQVPADGQPVIFGPDHPVTGGYPVIGVVEPADLDRLSQLPPGGTVRFVRFPVRAW